MSTAEFWHNVLEKDEKLLWTGRPKPRVHWRNWRLYGAAPMAAAGLLAAAGFILTTYGTANDIWLLLIPAVLVLIPIYATWKQLRTYAISRYALTDKRALFFQIKADQTRIKSHPLSAICPPKQKRTLPETVKFIRYKTDREDEFGFDYVDESKALVSHIERLIAVKPSGAEVSNVGH